MPSHLSVFPSFLELFPDYWQHTGKLILLLFFLIDLRMQNFIEFLYVILINLISKFLSNGVVYKFVFKELFILPSHLLHKLIRRLLVDCLVLCLKVFRKALRLIISLTLYTLYLSQLLVLIVSKIKFLYEVFNIFGIVLNDK